MKSENENKRVVLISEVHKIIRKKVLELFSFLTA
jgi:hypothetical protein